MSNLNNLTALRWLAAGMVLFGHSFVFLGLPEPVFMSWVPLGPLGVYVFFAISGYLIAQSWESDPNLIRFLWRRALRIFPGLIVCIVLSVFILGPLMTTLPVADYFSDLNTWGYFTNVFLYITYYLPGVFSEVRVPNAVNGSLWSLPAEFFMYLVLSFVGLFRFPRFGFVCIAILLILLTNYWVLPSTEMFVVFRTDVRQVVMCGAYFWVGACFFKYDLSRYFSVSNVLGAVMVWLSLSRWPSLFVIAGGVMVPFFALAFGLARSPLLVRLSKFDYSYGIYIYAFPVQQSVVSVWPHMSLPVYLIVTVLVTLFLAALSWHFVEQPMLRFKPTRPRPMPVVSLSAAAT